MGTISFFTHQPGDRNLQRTSTAPTLHLAGYQHTSPSSPHPHPYASVDPHAPTLAGVLGSYGFPSLVDRFGPCQNCLPYPTHSPMNLSTLTLQQFSKVAPGPLPELTYANIANTVLPCSPTDLTTPIHHQKQCHKPGSVQADQTGASITPKRLLFQEEVKITKHTSPAGDPAVGWGRYLV